MAGWWEELDGPLLGRYRIDRLLGEGGMARVFAATDLKSGRIVAIKTPKIESFPPDRVEELLGRFNREFDSQARDPIQGVIPIYESGEFTDNEGVVRPFLVMQYLPGGSLGDALGGSMGRRERTQTIGEVLDWLVPIARTLDRLHARKYLHRDVKPDNILFNTDGDPFLADFGIVGTLDTKSGASMMTAAATGMLGAPGSPGYQAPESIQSEPSLRNISASDQFSLAVTVYEALSGSLPAQAGSLHEWIAALLQWSPVPLMGRCPDMPVDAAAAVMKAMNAQPHARFTSCSEFAKAVAAAAVALPAAAHVKAPPVLPPLLPPTRPAASNAGGLPWTWIGAIGVLFVAGAAWWAMRDFPPSPTSAATAQTKSVSLPPAASTTSSPAGTSTALATTPATTGTSVLAADATAAACDETDADKDSVIDCDDDCPKTQPRAAVNTVGCPTSRAQPWKEIRFDADKASSSDFAALSDALDSLNGNPQQRIRIRGYADVTEGSAAYAIGLSDRRANSVRDFFEAKGVDPGRMEVESRGVSDPVAPSLRSDGSRNTAGVQRNRRVELELLPPAPEATTEPGEVELVGRNSTGVRVLVATRGDRLLFRAIEPGTSAMGIYVDVNADGRVDRSVDRTFGATVWGKICAGAWVQAPDSGTACETAATAAQASQKSVGGVMTQRVDIPLSEVSTNGQPVHLMIKVVNFKPALDVKYYWLTYDYRSGRVESIPPIQ
jgi:serine/threonine protein kinase